MIKSLNEEINEGRERVYLLHLLPSSLCILEEYHLVLSILFHSFIIHQKT